MKFTKIQIALMAVLAIVIIGGGVFFFFPYNATAPATTGNQEASSTTVNLSNPNGTGVIQGNGYTIEQVPAIDVLAQMPSPDRPIQFSASVPAEVRTLLSQRAADLAVAIKKNPENAGNWFELAIQYHTANDYEGAKAIWLGLVKLIPKDATALGNLGRLYEFDLHDFAKAESYFKQALALSAKMNTYYLELHELYANSYKVGTGADLAIDKQGIKAFPDSPDFYVLAGDDSVKMGDNAAAKSYYQQALAIAKNGNNAEMTIAIQQKIDKLPQ